jgi:hypothetical protein
MSFLISDIHEPMQNLITRLETFKEWPKSYIKPQDLANAGFYYTGICKSISPI